MRVHAEQGRKAAWFLDDVEADYSDISADSVLKRWISAEERRAARAVRRGPGRRRRDRNLEHHDAL